MKIILISGKARHGKDQVAIYIKKELEKYNKKLIILHYADFLKSFCKENLGWDGNKDENGRKMLQYYGTDVIRKTYPDTWVDMMIALVKGLNNEYDYILIPDARFYNEIDKMKENFCCIDVRVERSNFNNNLTEEQKNHISETALDNYPFQYILINDEGLEKLKKTVETFIKDII